MKVNLIFTKENNIKAISNSEFDKAISLRGAFIIGKGMGHDGNSTKRIDFKNANGGYITSTYANENQFLPSPETFNYIPVLGADILVEVLDLNEGEKVYIEVEYEIISLDF